MDNSIPTWVLVIQAGFYLFAMLLFSFVPNMLLFFHKHGGWWGVPPTEEKLRGILCGHAKFAFGLSFIVFTTALLTEGPNIVDAIGGAATFLTLGFRFRQKALKQPPKPPTSGGGSV